jgi:hypothetical protein
LNGPTVDIVGARRFSIRHSLLLCTAFVILALSQSPHTAINACFLVEFANRIQWPCNIVLLSSHTNQSQGRAGQSQGRAGKTKISNNFETEVNRCSNDGESNETVTYDNGIFISSLDSRCESLVGITFWSYLLRFLQQSTITTTIHLQISWRLLAGLGAWIALLTTSVTYFYITNKSSIEPC